MTNLRERKKSATRKALEEAAVELFALKGFVETTVDDIAAAADVSRSTFFRYFGSKEAVLFGDADGAGSLFLELIRERPATEGPLTAFKESLIEVSARTEGRVERDTYRAREELMQKEPVLRARRIAEMERWTNDVALAFAERGGRDKPEGEDRVAAAICMAATKEIGEDWRRLDDAPSAAEAIQNGFDVVRRLIAGV